MTVIERQAPLAVAAKQPRKRVVKDLRAKEAPAGRLKHKMVCEESLICEGEKEAFLAAVSESQAFGGRLDHVVRRGTAEKLHWAAFRRHVRKWGVGGAVFGSELQCVRVK